MSVRPVHRMIAHSAFIIVARRLSDTQIEVPAISASPGAVVEASEDERSSQSHDDARSAEDGIADEGDPSDGDFSDD